MTNEKVFREQLELIYERRKDMVSISPAWLATELIKTYDPAGRLAVFSDELYTMAHAHGRQLARSICRQRCEPDAADIPEQHSLFPQLQTRYPIARSSQDDEPLYVLLEHLKEQDVRYNVRRLRQEADAKNEHADALEAWWQKRNVA